MMVPQGIGVILRTTHPEQMRRILTLCDFEITSTDPAAITLLDAGHSQVKLVVKCVENNDFDKRLTGPGNALKPVMVPKNGCGITIFDDVAVVFSLKLAIFSNYR